MAVALSISTHDVKLMATRGDVLDKWVVAPLPSGAVKDGRILQPQAVAGVINSLLKMLNIPRTPVVASISGMSFTYRLLKLPQMKPSRLREAVERATQKEINVPLDEMYIDWQTLPAEGNGIDVFVLGVPRSQIDLLLDTAKLVNLELSAVDLKSLALARASGLHDGLIVDFETDGFNIIILSQGVPVILHAFNPKSSKASLEDNVRQLIDEMDRTIDFYNITHKDQPIPADAPVLLTGELATGTAVDFMQQNSIHPVKSLSTHFKIPADFPVSSFAGNIGLILKKDSARAGGRSRSGSGEVNINPLLGRKRVLSHSVSLRKIRMPAALVAAFLLVAALTVFRNNAVAETASLQAEMTDVTRTVYLQNLALSQAEETQAAITRLTAETSALQQESQQLSGRGSLSGILTAVLENLPDNVHLSSIVSTPGEIILQAAAGSRADVIEYARRLEAAGAFSAVRIGSLDDVPLADSGGIPPVAFKIIIER
jgi:type IV pilus assembly protein PilM